MNFLDRKNIIGDKVYNFQDDKTGVVRAVEQPPESSHGRGTDLEVEWESGDTTWVDAGDVGILK